MFALTANDGTKRYGYCRRYFSKKALPKAYCFISLMYFAFEKFLLLFNRFLISFYSLLFLSMIIFIYIFMLNKKQTYLYISISSSSLNIDIHFHYSNKLWILLKLVLKFYLKQRTF